MAKLSNVFVCQSCGTVHAKWAGRCDACGEWNTLIEEIASQQSTKPTGGAGRKTRKSAIDFTELTGDEAELPRMVSGIHEFDRVAGGGLIQGSAILVGGEPGIGKSTLLLQVMAALTAKNQTVAYISGEEAIDQIRRRAKRLKLANTPVKLAAETALGPIIEGLKAERADVVVIDSIQTLWSDSLGAAPGTVAQVRACAQELVRFAKKSGTSILLVGHVTKDGQIAGPRVVEHMVDAVFYFEGDRGHQFRLLRAIKNRFGPTDEIGVFEMSEMGLQEVANPSALFLDGRGEETSGAAVFAGMEGTRPLLTEIQALVAPAAFGTPRRAVVGWDSGRLAMILAVLETRCGVTFGGKDVYLNVAGGLKIAEPAADLAVAAAITSAAFDIALPANSVIFGEISLSGDVRNVGRSDARLKEAAKLGFTRAITPQIDMDSAIALPATRVKTLPELVSRIEAGANGDEAWT